jgi:hypothetical protein
MNTIRSQSRFARKLGAAAITALILPGLSLVAACGADTRGDEPEGSSELVGHASEAVVDVTPLLYGQIYNFQNGYGGWLDTRVRGCEGNVLCVSTAASNNRDSSSGSWTLTSATGKLAGTPVLSGDQVFLKNMYSADGGYLDTRNTGCEGNLLCVSTATAPNRDGGSGTWKIQGDGAADGAPLSAAQEVRLQNGWNSFGGGYLDTRGAGCEGNLFCVSTSSTRDRDNASTHWKLMPLPTLLYGHVYDVQNGYGGVLDTRGAGCEGNKLCVSTGLTNDRDSGSGSWTLMSATGKLAGTPVVSGDQVYLKNMYGADGGYLDTRNTGCEGNLLCVSTATTPNRDGGSGTWKIQGDGAAAGAPLSAAQEVRLQNGWNSFGGGYLDTRGAGCEGNLFCVSTSSTQDRDNASTHWRLTPWVSDGWKAALVARFAPRLRFDGNGHGYPMSAQTFYTAAVEHGQTARVENTDASTLGSGTLPTYYQVISCGSQLRIKYWWFYGYQNVCDGVSGSHNGDWEDATVTLSENTSSVAAVTFTMHGHAYTRLAARGGFDVEDSTHPVVYAAKNSHASIYTQGGSSTTCLPWEEFRNNTSGTHLDSWSKLVELAPGVEPWMAVDKLGNFGWGSDGVGTHPMNNGPSCSMNAADWTFEVPTWWHSQCETGDRDDGTSCHSRCRSGYTDMGFTCTNWDITSLDTYGQHLYGYDYTLPTSDVGLLTPDPR